MNASTRPDNMPNADNVRNVRNINSAGRTHFNHNGVTVCDSGQIAFCPVRDIYIIMVICLGITFILIFSGFLLQLDFIDDCLIGVRLNSIS